jgi:hypothetical protein
MPLSHTIANYAKEKFNEEGFEDLAYYMCFDDNFVFPVHYEYKEIALLEHWKVLATAAQQNLSEIVSDKTLTHVFVTAKIVCPPVTVGSHEEMAKIQEEAIAWVLQQKEEGNEDAKLEDHPDMKQYIVVEGFDGQEFETIVLEIVDGVIDGGLSFDNDYSKQKGFLPYLAPGIVLCWLKGQDNYEELLPIYLGKGLVEVPLEELDGFVQQQVEETDSEEEAPEVISVDEETDDEN